MSNSLSVETSENAVVIRFIRPQRRNPLSVHVLDEIAHALGAAAETQYLIITGTEGVFASGADLKEIEWVHGEGARAFAERGQHLMNRIAAMTATTIAAVNGPCYGGALDLALACDHRIALPGATFCHPGASLGIITGWGGTQRLPRLVGEANALKLFLTAEPIDAPEALRIGLIDAVLPGIGPQNLIDAVQR